MEIITQGPCSLILIEGLRSICNYNLNYAVLYLLLLFTLFPQFSVRYFQFCEHISHYQGPARRGTKKWNCISLVTDLSTPLQLVFLRVSFWAPYFSQFFLKRSWHDGSAGILSGPSPAKNDLWCLYLMICGVCIWSHSLSSAWIEVNRRPSLLWT